MFPDVLQVLCHEVHISCNAFIIFSALNSISPYQSHLICFRHKYRLLKMLYISNRWDVQDNKQRIQEQSTCILLYNTLYYSSKFMYHEITTKSFARPTVIILCKL